MLSRQQARHDDIPGAIVFTGAMCRKGYALNQFCMSLMRADERARFKADEAAYLDDWSLTADQRQAVLGRDYRAMLSLGGNIFYVLKLAATDGRSVQSVVASIAGQAPEDFAAMMLAGGRPPEGLPADRRAQH
ncbi:MAG: protocatechuate 4,5-dioxygenase subunit alpha [Caulobacteraceae bacterium]